MIALYQKTDRTFVRLPATKDSHGKWKLSSNKGPLDVTDLPGLRFIKMVDEREEDQFRRDLVDSDCFALIRPSPGVLHKLDVLIHEPTGRCYVLMNRQYWLAEEVLGFEKFELKVPPPSAKVEPAEPVEERRLRSYEEYREFARQDEFKAMQIRQQGHRQQVLDSTHSSPRQVAMRTAFQNAALAEHEKLQGSPIAAKTAYRYVEIPPAAESDKK